MHTSGVDPMLVSDSWVICRNQMRKYEQLDAGSLSDAPCVLGGRMTSEKVFLESGGAGGPSDDAIDCW